MNGWCLPSSSGNLELSNQPAPTRGDTDGTIPRPGRPRSQLDAGSAVPKRQATEAERDRDERPGAGGGDPGDPRSQAALLRGGHTERLALRDPESPCPGDRRGHARAQPGSEERRAGCPWVGGEAPERPDRASGVQPAARTGSHAQYDRAGPGAGAGATQESVPCSGDPDARGLSVRPPAAGGVAQQAATSCAQQCGTAVCAAGLPCRVEGGSGAGSDPGIEATGSRAFWRRPRGSDRFVWRVSCRS
jgi:hypothetical protein